MILPLLVPLHFHLCMIRDSTFSQHTHSHAYYTHAVSLFQFHIHFIPFVVCLFKPLFI
ncbi:hypothetical protein BCR42DRAFT_216165 [Absidia repens]|uniref:Uncharacterized protein n=1 Tax=Absidia repens TaxID=90262 RepID=A0A1X2HDU8_9FUNG|nr:hypothetical protein BCR42DRAFT_216165 [Absidia repens]